MVPILNWFISHFCDLALVGRLTLLMKLHTTFLKLSELLQLLAIQLNLLRLLRLTFVLISHEILKDFLADKLYLFLALSAFLALFVKEVINFTGELSNILDNINHLVVLILKAFFDSQISWRLLNRLTTIILLDWLGHLILSLALSKHFLLLELLGKVPKQILDLVSHLTEMLQVNVLAISDFLASLLNEAKLFSLFKDVAFLLAQLVLKSLSRLHVNFLLGFGFVRSIAIIIFVSSLLKAILDVSRHDLVNLSAQNELFLIVLGLGLQSFVLHIGAAEVESG